MQQQEFIKRYWKQGDKVLITYSDSRPSVEAIVEAESVVDPGWVYVREVGLGGRRGPLHRVQAAMLAVQNG